MTGVNNANSVFIFLRKQILGLVKLHRWSKWSGWSGGPGGEGGQGGQSVRYGPGGQGGHCGPAHSLRDKL